MGRAHPTGLNAERYDPNVAVIEFETFIEKAERHPYYLQFVSDTEKRIQKLKRDYNLDRK